MTKSRIVLALLALAPAALFADTNDAKLALAREAITAMQADKMFDNLAAQMKQMVAQQTHLPPTATEAQRQEAADLQAKILDLSMGEAKALVTRMDAVYAQVYDEAELKAMIAFFNSPQGQSMMAKQPDVMRQIMPLVQQMQQSLVPKVQALVQSYQAKNMPAPAGPIPTPSAAPGPIPTPSPGPGPMPTPKATP